MKTKATLRYFRSYLPLAAIIFSHALAAQDTILPLWPEAIPNRIETAETEVHDTADILRISKVQEPTLAVYLPSKANHSGKGVLIFPGGGYRILAYDWEGTDIAKWLNSKGIAAFVVKYRLPVSRSLTGAHEVPLMDAQRAIRLVRGHYKEWNLAEDQIGCMGFSAGGHLAASLGVHFNAATYEPQDAMDMLSARPDFMALIYPVISFSPEVGHSGSKEALLGKEPDPGLVTYFSNELHISPDTPPTLLIHATDDSAVSPENSILFYQGLRNKGVPASLHLYARGGHGFSLAPADPYLRDWTNRVTDWLEFLDE